MSRRIPPLVLLLAAIVAMVVIGRNDDPSPITTSTSREGPPAPSGPGLPVAATKDALSSTWYCAGGTTDDSGFANHTVIVENASDVSLSGTLTIYRGAVAHRTSTATTSTTARSTTTTTAKAKVKPPPPPISVPFELRPQSRREFPLADEVHSELASAVVEVPGGEVAVEHRVSSRYGRDTAPCATEGSSEWYFAWGATTRNARELLVFFNPYPDPAVIDGSFATDQGPRETSRFVGFTVPGRSVVGIDLGEDVTIRKQIAASFKTRRGRVIIDRIERFKGDTPPIGLTVRLGMTQPKLVWMFADGVSSDEVVETYLVYNPTEKAAEIQLELIPNDATKTGYPEPYEASLLPGMYQQFVIKPGDRIKSGLGHGAVVRSLNNVGVVAERVLATTGESDRHGISVTSGSPVAAPVWLFADGEASDDRDTYLYLYNPSAEFAATISVTVPANGQTIAVDGLQGLRLGPSRRIAIRLGDKIERERLPLVVKSSEPIVIERGIYAADGIGFSNAIGIPLDQGLVTIAPLETGSGG